MTGVRVGPLLLWAALAVCVYVSISLNPASSRSLLLPLSCYYFIKFFIIQRHPNTSQSSTSIISYRRPLRNHFPSNTDNKTAYHTGTKLKHSDCNYSNY